MIFVPRVYTPVYHSGGIIRRHTRGGEVRVDTECLSYYTTSTALTGLAYMLQLSLSIRETFVSDRLAAD